MFWTHVDGNTEFTLQTAGSHLRNSAVLGFSLSCRSSSLSLSYIVACRENILFSTPHRLTASSCRNARRLLKSSAEKIVVTSPACFSLFLGCSLELSFTEEPILHFFTLSFIAEIVFTFMECRVVFPACSRQKSVERLTSYLSVRRLPVRVADGSRRQAPPLEGGCRQPRR